MSNRNLRLILGVLLVVAGILFLLQQIFDFPIGALFIGLLFAAGGAAFLFILARDRSKWWAAIPGFTLLGLGALIALARLLPEFSNRFGAAVFLGAIAMSFVAILLLRPSDWWPVIPAGVLVTLALVTTIPGGSGSLGGGLFFLGIGLTFAAINFVPSGKNEKWAWIPGGICTLFGLILVASSGALVEMPFGWIVSLIIVGVGVFLVVRSLVKKG